jgi:hypothetical protein
MSYIEEVDLLASPQNKSHVWMFLSNALVDCIIPAQALEHILTSQSTWWKGSIVILLF